MFSRSSSFPRLSRLALILGFLVFVGCGPRACGKRQDVSPEEQLRTYIDLAVNITRMEQREELESYTTGELRDQLTSSSPEAFKKSYLERRYDFELLEMLGQTEVVPNKETHLEYRVKFKTWVTGEDDKRSPVQEIRSLAIMKYVNGQWAIASIRPLDTDYTWGVGMPMEGVSTQGITVDSPVVDPYADSNAKDSAPATSGGAAEAPQSSPANPAPQPASESAPGK